MKTIITAIITTATDLLNIITKAKNGGQFATIYGETNRETNQFPNQEYCDRKGITLASGKGSKALNEPYRYGGERITRRFSVTFHFDQNYDRTLADAGFSRSEESTCKDIHLGTIAVAKPTTQNICLVYMQGSYNSGEYRIDGRIPTEEEMAYIKGYLRVKAPNPKDQAIGYRTIGVRYITEIAFGGCRYKVNIPEISEGEYKAIIGQYRPELAEVDVEVA